MCTQKEMEEASDLILETMHLNKVKMDSGLAAMAHLLVTAIACAGSSEKNFDGFLETMKSEFLKAKRLKEGL